MTALPYVVFVPVVAAVVGLLVFVGFRLREALIDWRERRGDPYIPTRPVTDRYGATEADPGRGPAADTAIKLPPDQVDNSGIG